MTTQRTRAPEFFDIDKGAELLRWSSLDEAVEMGLDAMVGPLPRTLTVYGWATKVRDIDVDRIAERIAEELDQYLGDEYGNPEEATELPPDINDAIELLAKIVSRQWPVWQCEVVSEYPIDIVAWMHQNRCNWLKEDGVTFMPEGPAEAQGEQG